MTLNATWLNMMKNCRINLYLGKEIRFLVPSPRSYGLVNDQLLAELIPNAFLSFCDINFLERRKISIYFSKVNI